MLHLMQYGIYVQQRSININNTRNITIASRPQHNNVIF